jgi:hypothetical protein
MGRSGSDPASSHTSRFAECRCQEESNPDFLGLRRGTAEKSIKLQRRAGGRQATNGFVEKMHILVAAEPRTYREVITCVLRELRPHIEVDVVEPDDLDGEVARLRPHLVVCSRITVALQALLGWVMLYPDGENRAEIFTAGEWTTVDNVGFGDLLSVIDRVELLFAGEADRLA